MMKIYISTNKAGVVKKKRRKQHGYRVQKLPIAVYQKRRNNIRNQRKYFTADSNILRS